MKKNLFLALIVSVFISSAVFAQTIETAFTEYTDAQDVVPIQLSAKINETDGFVFSWEEPAETDLEFYALIVSTEDSTPEYLPGDADIIMHSVNDAVELSQTDTTYSFTVTHFDQGISYYRMCVYTILGTRVCGNVVPVYINKSLVLEPAVEGFSDIAGHWAEKYIEKLRVLNVVAGYEDGTFRPNTNILRAEAFKIFMLTFGIGGTSCHADFYPDMGPEDWFCDVVSKATQLGYVQGDQGNLYPGREITRAESVKVVLEIMQEEIPEITEKPFDDVELDQWYAPYIAKAKELNIVQGMGNNVFEPNRSITRAELSKVAAEAAKL